MNGSVRPVRRRKNGNALIEFAIAFGFLLTIFAGAFEVGYVYFVYNQLESAVHGAARFASLQTYSSTTANPRPEFSNAVKNMVVYGNPNGSGSPVVPGLTTSHVAVVVDFERGVPERITVAIDGHQLNAIFRNLRLTMKPRASFPYIGRYDPIG